MPYLTQEEYDELEAEAANAAALTARVKELEEAINEIDTIVKSRHFDGNSRLDIQELISALRGEA